VENVMMDLDSFPIVEENTIFKEALEKMNFFNVGITCITNTEHKLLGILTDGDIRRKLVKVQKPFSAFFVDDALDHAIKSPITVHSHDSLKKAVALMEEKQIWDIPVVDKQARLVGLLHLHPAIKALLEL
jgi:arabinose-5-phosphate isomerase